MSKTVVWFSPLRRRAGAGAGARHRKKVVASRVVSASGAEKQQVLETIIPSRVRKGKRLPTPSVCRNPPRPWAGFDPPSKFAHPVLERLRPDYVKAKVRHPAKPTRLVMEDYVAIRGRDGYGGRGLMRATLFCSNDDVGQAVFAATDFSDSIDGIHYAGGHDKGLCRVFLSLKAQNLCGLYDAVTQECKQEFHLAVTPTQHSKNWCYYPKRPKRAPGDADKNYCAVSANADHFSDTCSELLAEHTEGNFDFWKEEHQKACGFAQRNESEKLLSLIKQMGLASLTWKRNVDGFTLLHCACKYGQLNAANKLMLFASSTGGKAGASQRKKMLTMRDNQGRTPTDLAYEKWKNTHNTHPRIPEFRRLCGLTDPRTLFKAAKHGVKYRVEFLLEESGDPIRLGSLANANGQTALHFACAEDRAEIALLLTRECHADWHIPNNAGKTPIMLARANHAVSVLEVYKSQFKALAKHTLNGMLNTAARSRRMMKINGREKEAIRATSMALANRRKFSSADSLRKNTVEEIRRTNRLKALAHNLPNIDLAGRDALRNSFEWTSELKKAGAGQMPRHPKRHVKYGPNHHLRYPSCGVKFSSR